MRKVGFSLLQLYLKTDKFQSVFTGSRSGAFFSCSKPEGAAKRKGKQAEAAALPANLTNAAQLGGESAEEAVRLGRKESYSRKLRNQRRRDAARTSCSAAPLLLRMRISSERRRITRRRISSQSHQRVLLQGQTETPRREKRRMLFMLI